MLHVVAMLLYTGAFGLWLRSLISGGREESRSGLPPVVALAGLAVHGAALAGFRAEYGELPLVGLGPAMSTLAFLVGLGLLVLLAMREAARVGIVLMPVVVLLQAVALAVGIEPSASDINWQGFWFSLHVTLAFLGYTGLALAFASGVLYLVQFRELKDKRLGRFFRFIPSLPSLDRVLRMGLWGGLAALTAGLTLGWVWMFRFDRVVPDATVKIAWGMATWLVLVAALAARRGGGRSERRAAMVAVWGFVAIVASYLVLRVFMGGGSFL